MFGVVDDKVNIYSFSIIASIREMAVEALEICVTFISIVKTAVHIPLKAIDGDIVMWH